MNEERTVKCLRYVQHIRDTLRQRYSVMVKQVIVATVRLSRWCWTNIYPWFSSFLDSSNPLSRKYWQEPQALEYRINWEISHAVERGHLGLSCPVYKQWMSWFMVKKWHQTPMDGMSSLQTITHVIKRGYVWMGWPVYKQWITWIKVDTYGYDLLFINNESCG